MPNLITGETLREVEQFLYREARLLDNRRFSEWLELFSDDLRYWMPTRSNRYPLNSKAISILDASRYEEEEVSGEDELAFMEETKKTLEMRVARLDTGRAWAELAWYQANTYRTTSFGKLVGDGTKQPLVEKVRAGFRVVTLPDDLPEDILHKAHRSWAQWWLEHKPERDLNADLL